VKVEKVRLGDVLTRDRQLVAVDPGLRYISIGVRGFGRGLFRYPEVAGSELGKLRFFEVEPDRLIVSNIKAWEGAVARSGGHDVGLIASNRFLQFTCSPRLDLQFVQHFLLSEEGIRQLGQASPGSADRNRTLSIKSFEAIQVPLPPIDQQRRITARLERIAAVDRRSHPPARRSTAVDALWRGLPSGRPIRLDQLLERRAESEGVDDDETYTFLGMRWYGGGPFAREVIPGIAVRAKKVFRVRAGDVIYNRLFAWKGSFGVIDDRTAGSVVSNEFPTFTVNREAVDAAYLRLCLEQPAFWAAAEELSTGSTPTSRNRLKEEQFLGMSIPVPCPAAQQAAVVKAGLMRGLAERRHRAGELAKALLPAARNEVFSQFR